MRTELSEILSVCSKVAMRSWVKGLGRGILLSTAEIAPASAGPIQIGKIRLPPFTRKTRTGALLSESMDISLTIISRMAYL